MNPLEITEYDEWFQLATEKYLLHYYWEDWQLLKAQGIAESNLDPKAVSPVFAMGIMQFMPATWSDMMAELDVTDVYDPRQNILAGGYYMGKMLNVFNSDRDESDRRRWAWSAYNWGAGNVLKAQKRADGALDWESVKPFLPTETQNYVVRTERYHGQLLSNGSAK